MAANPQEELSMEEILSSIRNILMDGDNVSAQAEEVEETIEEIEDLSAKDSVFDLSKEMMVEEKSPLEYSPIVESTEIADIDPINDIDSLIGDDDFSIDDIKLDIIEDDIKIKSEPLTSHDKDLLVEDEDNALVESLEDDLQADLDTGSDQEISFEIEKNLEEEFIETQEDDLEEVLQNQLEQETIGIPDDSLLKELEDGRDEDLMPSFNDIKVDTTSEPIYEAEETKNVIEEPEEVIIEQKTYEPQKQEVKSETLTYDTSEKILNKFAQIFEEDKQRRIIEDVAREEISEKTSAWLDKNLQNIVVDLVQKEVERVMAKVGK